MSNNRDSSVGIATRYGLNGPGIESMLNETGKVTFNVAVTRDAILLNGTTLHPFLPASLSWSRLFDNI